MGIDFPIPLLMFFIYFRRENNIVPTNFRFNTKTKEKDNILSFPITIKKKWRFVK